MASVRRQALIARPAERVWRTVGDPTTLASWFPGIVEVAVDGSTRSVTTASGLTIPEEIVTNDPLQRRFQYRITAPMVRDHLGTIDVLEISEDSSLVVYATDCRPDAMALMIAGAAHQALAKLKGQLEEEGGVD